MSSAKTFGVLAILLALAGFGAWWYISSRPKQPSSLIIQKIETPSPSPGSSPDPSRLFYKISVPKGGWYDTGIWVRPWKYVNAISTGQPAELLIGGTTNHARLMKKGIFNAVIVTTDDLSGNTFGQYEGEDLYQELAPVGDQGKIYIKLSDEATVDQVDVLVQIESVPDEEISSYYSAQSWSSRHKEALIRTTIATTVGIGCVILGFIFGRISGWWKWGQRSRR